MSESKIVKRAQRFTSIVADKVNKDEELVKVGVETFFKQAVRALPDGSLKNELNANASSYLNHYISLLKTDAEPNTTSKDYPYNLFIKNGYKVNEEIVKKLPGEKQKSIYTCLLAQRVDKLKNEDILEKRLQKCTMEDEQDKLPWLKNIHLLCSLLITKCEGSVLQKTMKLFHKNLLNSVEMCITKKRLKRLERLQTETLQFLYFCHVFNEQLQQSFDKPSYGECVAGILAVYYDMLVTINSDAEETDWTVCGKRLTGVAQYLLQSQPHHILDMLLPQACLSLEKKDGKVSKAAESIILPLARRALVQPLEGKGNQAYVKYTAAVRQMKLLFSKQLADEIQTAYSVGAPDSFISWVQDERDEILDEMPVTRHFVGVEITKFLLNEAPLDLIEKMLDILVESMVAVEQSMQVKMQSTSTDTGQSLEVTDSPKPEEADAPLFFMDTGGDTKTAKQLKKELGIGKKDLKNSHEEEEEIIPEDELLDDEELDLDLEGSEDKENEKSQEDDDEVMLVSLDETSTSNRSDESNREQKSATELSVTDSTAKSQAADNTSQHDTKITTVPSTTKSESVSRADDISSPAITPSVSVKSPPQVPTSTTALPSVQSSECVSKDIEQTATNAEVISSDSSVCEIDKPDEDKIESELNSDTKDDVMEDKDIIELDSDRDPSESQSSDIIVLDANEKDAVEEKSLQEVSVTSSDYQSARETSGLDTDTDVNNRKEQEDDYYSAQETVKTVTDLTEDDTKVEDSHVTDLTSDKEDDKPAASDTVQDEQSVMDTNEPDVTSVREETAPVDLYADQSRETDSNSSASMEVETTVKQPEDNKDENTDDSKSTEVENSSLKENTPRRSGRGRTQMTPRTAPTRKSGRRASETVSKDNTHTSSKDSTDEPEASPGKIAIAVDEDIVLQFDDDGNSSGDKKAKVKQIDRLIAEEFGKSVPSRKSRRKTISTSSVTSEDVAPEPEIPVVGKRRRRTMSQMSDASNASSVDGNNQTDESGGHEAPKKRTYNKRKSLPASLSSDSDVNTPKRRGRPPKRPIPEQIVEKDAAEEVGEVIEEPVPSSAKRRGRPPKGTPAKKVKTDSDQADTEESVGTSTPRPRGRPPKQAAGGTPSTSQEEKVLPKRTLRARRDSNDSVVSDAGSIASAKAAPATPSKRRSLKPVAKDTPEVETPSKRVTRGAVNTEASGRKNTPRKILE